MSVGSQVADAMRKLSEGRFEDAVVTASVALSATARLEFQKMGTKRRAASSWSRTSPSSVRSDGCHSASRNPSTSGIDG